MSEAHISAPDILILDLKTSGLYLRNESIDSAQQPWAPYIGAMQCNAAGAIVNHFCAYIQPAGRMVKGGALDKHGIDHKLAGRLGIPESRALGFLTDMLKVATFDTHMKVVTFGDMDSMIVASLLSRFAVSLGKPSNSFDRLWLSRPLTEFIDLQKPFAQQVCALPSDVEDSHEFRWPTFDEAIVGILDRSANPRRDGFHDLLLAKDMYFNLAGRGAFFSGAAA